MEDKVKIKIKKGKRNATKATMCFQRRRKREKLEFGPIYGPQ
jgi:hypothetical protein